MYGISIFGHYFYSHRATKLSNKALSEQQIQLLQCQEHFLWIHKLKKTVGSLKQFNKKQTCLDGYGGGNQETAELREN